MEMLTFEVARFDIGYNCIIGRPFLLKFMAVIHTAYTMIKMSNPNGVITLKLYQRDGLACENGALTYARKFDEKEAQDLTTKMVKTHGGSTPTRTVMPRSAVESTPRQPAAKKGMMIASTSNQPAIDQPVANEKKGATDKEILVDPQQHRQEASYQHGARSQIGTHIHHFSLGKSRYLHLADIRSARDPQRDD
jgi:hypothetical protein